MANNLLQVVLASPLFRRVVRDLATHRELEVSGAWGSAAPLLSGAVAQATGATVLYVVEHPDAADQAADDVEVLCGRKAQLFPAWEVDIGSEHINDEVAAERLRLCNLLTQPTEKRDEPVEVIVAPILALLQPIPRPESLRASRLAVAVGESLDPEVLIAWLVDAGFDAAEQVEQQGEFARRGGIVDVFPPGASQAVRVEFFGDEIESIRRVDLDTQRSTATIDGYDFTSLRAAHRTDDAPASLAEYLPPDTIVCIPSPDVVQQAADTIHDRLQRIHASESVRVTLSPQRVFGDLGRFARCGIHAFSPPGGGRTVDLGVRGLEKLGLQTHDALSELEDLTKKARVWVFCENPAQRDRFLELIGESHPLLAREVKVALGRLGSAFHWPALKLAAAGHHELFHRYSNLRRIRRVRAGRPIESLLDLQAGEHVVHVGHGIAKFDGLRVMEKDGRKDEYLRLRFADGAVLSVPATQINLVQKYIGSKGVTPTLSKLGGKLWDRQKQRVEEAVRDMAADMLRTQAMRRTMPGHVYPQETDWQRKFAEEFPYVETEDQLATLRQIAADMASPQPMDRLLCGDVGYGKTELAMRAAFRVVEAGRQAAILVPTTVLAEQHYRTFRERFADFPFTVEMLNRFRTASQVAEVLKLLKLGQVDILIGTHRILSKDIAFADLGLVVIDEEQRFGVQDKEHLKNLRAEVDVLTMTATPIPRTLHMALLGLRDISSLTTPPMDRRAIHTEVTHYDDQLVREAILRELTRDGQVFFVHNRVMDIQYVTGRVQELVPDARIGIAHGQMPGRTIERVMLQFVRRELDVLVCTTIIESGLDIPSANTMIIHEADRYGLAELHQLRGRVGRYKHRAYCYLLLPETRPVRPVAAKRLKAIEEFSDLGAGFQIAMRDLEIRGAGNILGREQSGHIAAVGYELYCQLLEDAVRQLKGEPPREKVECLVDLGVDTHIPASYILSDRQRMEVYRRLYRAGDIDELAQLREGLLDAYGPVPQGVDVLLDVAEIRIHASRAGIASILAIGQDLVFAVRDYRHVQAVLRDAPGSVRLADSQTVHWRPPPVYRQVPTVVTVLRKRLREAMAQV